MKTSQYQPGFTLIEMMVVVAIIGLLASMSVLTFSRQQMNSRNARRAADLKNVQTALENYTTDVGNYPKNQGSGSVVNWAADINAVGFRTNRIGGTGAALGNYIYGLAPNYITKLPVDPKFDTTSTCCGYVYGVSPSGSEYAFLAYRTPEGSWDSSNAFFDPIRPSGTGEDSWKVSSAGGKNF